MANVLFCPAEKTLEVMDISGEIIVSLDNKPGITLPFSQRVRVYLDISSDLKLLDVKCGNEAEPEPMDLEFTLENQTDFENQTSAPAIHCDGDVSATSDAEADVSAMSDAEVDISAMSTEAASLDVGASSLQPPTQEVLSHTEQPSTNEELPLSDQPPTQEVLSHTEQPFTHEELPLSDQPPTQEVLSHTEQTSTQEELPLNEQPSSQEELPLSDQLPTQEVLSHTEQPSTHEELPLNDQPPTQEELPSSDQLFTPEVLHTEQRSGEEVLPVLHKEQTSVHEVLPSIEQPSTQEVQLHTEQLSPQEVLPSSEQMAMQEVLPDVGMIGPTVTHIKPLKLGRIFRNLAGKASPVRTVAGISPSEDGQYEPDTEQIDCEAICICTYCGNEFPNDAKLRDHHRVPNIVTVCQRCGEDFENEADLFMHQYKNYSSSFMANQYPTLIILDKSLCVDFQCPLCSKYLMAVSDVPEHLRNDHFKKASFACCVCDFTHQKHSFLEDHLKKTGKCTKKKQFNKKGDPSSIGMTTNATTNTPHHDEKTMTCSDSTTTSATITISTPHSNKETMTSSDSITATTSTPRPNEETMIRSDSASAYKAKTTMLYHAAVQTMKSKANAQKMRGKGVRNGQQPGKLLSPEPQATETQGKVLSLNSKQDAGTSSCSSTQTDVSLPEKISTGIREKEPEFYCDYCEKTFVSQNEKAAHHLPPEVAAARRISCQKCGEDFSCKADLFIHQYGIYDVEYLQQQYPSLTILDKSLCGDFRCPLCKKVVKFRRKERLNRHIQTHFIEPSVSASSYVCCVGTCTFQTKRLSSLTFHLKTRHNEREKHKILISNNKGASSSTCSTNKEEDKNEQSAHSDKDSWSLTSESSEENSNHSEDFTYKKQKFPCIICGNRFNTKSDREHHRRIPLSVHCPKCPAVFASQALQVIHNFRVHDIELTEDERKEENSKRLCKGGSKEMEPDFDDFLGISDNVSRESSPCPICEMHVYRLGLESHIAFYHTNEMLYKCCICGESEPSIKALGKHSRIHGQSARRALVKKDPKKTVWRCKKCPKTFPTRCEFIKHSHIHRSQCSFCKRDFGHPHLLRAHYESQHADRVITCKVCKKPLATKRELQSHMANHKKKKPVLCPQCGIMVDHRFLRDHFDKHCHASLETTRDKTGDRNAGVGRGNTRKTSKPESSSITDFPCSQCHKTFYSKASLRCHIARHHTTRHFSCPTCRKAFVSRRQLTRHIDTVHLKLFTHTCEVCGKQTSDKTNLQTHMRTHASHMFYFCSVCGEGFNHNVSLQTHIRSKHSVDNAK